MVPGEAHGAQATHGADLTHGGREAVTHLNIAEGEIAVR
jgi:hypothetical protein